MAEDRGSDLVRRDNEWIVLARHFETDKNLEDLHGKSGLSELTEIGFRQAQSTAASVKLEYGSGLDGVIATPTPQAIVSAKLLAKLTGIPYEGITNIDPVDLGLASGLSTEDLYTKHPGVFRSLDLFRSRVIPASGLKIGSIESVDDIERRLIDWWMSEGIYQCPRRIVVGSNSTVLMLTHLFNGVLPSDPGYKCLSIPNGTFRAWYRRRDSWVAEPQFELNSWPDVDTAQVKSSLGAVAISRHYPNWAPRRTKILVVPGYFGSSRHGPYGLYSRLGRAWAMLGFETITLDLLGSGDSSPVYRDFESEVTSVIAVVREMQEVADSLIIVGHSMGGATALAARDRMEDSALQVWALAPLCTLRDLSVSFFSPRNVEEFVRSGKTLRHGLELRYQMVANAGLAWDSLHHTLDGVWVGGADQYASSVNLDAVPRASIHRVSDADHNFSGDRSFHSLLESTTVALAVME